MGSQSLGDLGSRWTAPWAHSPIDVFVMLPLSMVDADGVFRAAPWFGTALSVLAASGVRGVAVDVWWGLVEREPQCYCWAGYEQLFDLIKGKGLQIQVVMSFHACGGNVGDTAQIPLPAWVLQCGEHDPDLFFTDRPREGAGRRNREYLSIWADEAAALRGRTPLQCYEDFMQAFCNNFHQLLGSSLVDIVVGAGPCGELRYPAYVESNGWKFPGVGEFQCYDRRALACLAQAAREAGHPEWGYGGPHNAGDYASWPEDTDFFRVGGAWETEYGRFFLGWYSACLLRHADQLLAIAKRVLLRAMPPPAPPEAPPGTNCPSALPPNTLSLAPPPGAPPPLPQSTQVPPEQPHHITATQGCGAAGNGPPAPPPPPHTALPLLALDLSLLTPPPGPEGLRATTSPLGLLSSSSSSSRGLSCKSAGVAGAESDFAQLSTRSLPLLPSALLPGHPTPAPSTTPLRSPPRHRTHSQLRSPPPSSQFQHSSADLLALTSHSLTAACSEPGGGEGEESGAGEEGEEEYGQAALGLLQGAQALSQRLALVAKAEEQGSPAAAAAAAAAHPAQLSTASAASSRYASSSGRAGGWVVASAGTSPHSLPHIMIPALALMPQRQHQHQPQQQQQGHCPPPSHTAAHATPPAAHQQQEQERQAASPAADPPPPLTAPLAASSVRSGARGEQQASPSPSPSPPFPPPVLLPGASPDQAAGSSSGSSSAGLARTHLPSPLQRISCASGGQQQQQQQPTPGGTLLPQEPAPPPPWGSQQQPTCTTPPAAPPGAGGSMGGSSGSSSGGAAPGSRVSSSLPPGYVGGVQGYRGVPADCGQGSGSCLPLTDSAADMMALGGRRGGSGQPCLYQRPPPPPLASALPEQPGQAQQQQQQQQQQAPGPRQVGAGQQLSPQAEGSDPEGGRPEPAASHQGTRGVTGGSLGPAAGAPASATPGGGWGQDSWAGGAGGGTQPDTAQGPGPPPQLLPSQAASPLPPSLYPHPGTQHQGCLTPPPSAPLPPHLTLMRPAASLPAPAHPSRSAPHPLHPAAPSPLLPHHAATTGGFRPGLAPSIQTHSAGHPGGAAAACPDSRGPALWQHTPGLGLKIAGIHWWYRTRSHAAELTAGYYNTATHDGYAAILQVCARHSARLTLTCVEMCDAQHAQHAQCGPEGLLKQIRLLAARYAVPLAGENALPIFLAGGVDAVALDRIVFNTRAWYGPSSAAAAARHYLHQQQLRAQQEQQQEQQHDRAQHQEQQHDTEQQQQQQQRGLQQNGGWVGALGAAAVVGGGHDPPQALGWGHPDHPEATWGNGPPSSSSTAPPAGYPTTHPPPGASACTWLPSLVTQSALEPPPGRPAGLRAWGSLPPGGALHCPLPPQPTPQPQGLSSSGHAQGANGEGHSSSKQVSPPGGQASQGGRGLSRQPVLGRLRHVPTAASLTAIIGLAEGAAGLGGEGVAGGVAGPQRGGWSLSSAAVATGVASTQQQQQQQLRAQQPTTLRQAQEALARLEARQGGVNPNPNPAASTASSPGPSPASCTPPWSSYHTSGSSPSPAAAAAADADYLAGVPPHPPPLIRVSPPPPNNTSLPPALHALAEGQGWWEESCPPLPPPPGLPCSASSRGLLSGWGGGEGGRPSPPTRPTSAQSEPFSHHTLPPGRWGWPPHSASTGQQGGAMPPAPSAAWCALGHGWGSGGEKGDLGLGRPGEQSARVAASGLRSDSYADIVEPLPSLASFTLLRLGPELLLPSHQPPWLRFMTRMQQGGYVPC